MKYLFLSVSLLIASFVLSPVQGMYTTPANVCDNGLDKTMYPTCACPEGEDLQVILKADHAAICVESCGSGKVRSACDITADYDSSEIQCVMDAQPFCNCENGAIDNDCKTCPEGYMFGNDNFCHKAATPDTACTLEYDPVCGSDGVTYGNACAAAGAGIIVIFEGECAEDETPTACTKEYMPVCAALQVQCIRAPCPAQINTYDNRCMAEAEGAVVQYEGKCSNGILGADILVSRAHEQGLTKYDTVKDFRYDAYILREEASRMFVAFAKEILAQEATIDLGADFEADLDSETDMTLKGYIVEAFKYNIFNRKLNNGNAHWFYPKNHLTRGQALAILLRLAHKWEDESTTPWYKPYMESAIKLNYFSSSEFSGDMEAPITRGELIKWMNTIQVKSNTSAAVN